MKTLIPYIPLIVLGHLLVLSSLVNLFLLQKNRRLTQRLSMQNAPFVYLSKHQFSKKLGQKRLSTTQTNAIPKKESSPGKQGPFFNTTQKTNSMDHTLYTPMADQKERSLPLTQTTSPADAPKNPGEIDELLEEILKIERNLHAQNALKPAPKTTPAESV